jgi:hypothetical protein
LPDFLKSIFGFFGDGLSSLGGGFKSLLSSLLPASMTGPDSFLGSLFSSFQDGSKGIADGTGSAIDAVKNKVNELGHTKVGGAPDLHGFLDSFKAKLDEALTPSPGAVPDSLDWQGRMGFWSLDRLPAIRMMIFGEPRNPDGSFDIYSTPEGAFFRRFAAGAEKEIKSLVKRMEDPEVRKALGHKADEIVDWVKHQIPGGGPSSPTQPGNGGQSTVSGVEAVKNFKGTIVLWGNSHAGGEFKALEGGKAELIDRSLDGVSLSGAPPMTDIPSGSVVILNMGTNDLMSAKYRNGDTKNIEQLAGDIVAKAQEAKAQGATPIITGVQMPMDEHGDPAIYLGNKKDWGVPGFLESYISSMNDFNRVLKQKADAAGIKFSSTEKIPASERAPDHLHYTAEGYKHIVGDALAVAGLATAPSLGNSFNRSSGSLTEFLKDDTVPAPLSGKYDDSLIEAVPGGDNNLTSVTVGFANRALGVAGGPNPGDGSHHEFGTQYDMGIVQLKDGRKYHLVARYANDHNDNHPNGGKGPAFQHPGVSVLKVNDYSDPDFPADPKVTAPASRRAPDAAPMPPAPAPEPQAKALPSGGKEITLANTDGYTAQVYVPPGLQMSNGNYNVIYNFHGQKGLQEENLARANVNAVIVSVNVKGLTGDYAKAFSNPQTFRDLMTQTDKAVGGHAGHTALSSWSAGSGALGKILAQREFADRVDAVFMADSLYGGHVGDTKQVDEKGLKPFIDFARRAKDGEKVFAMTHSSIETPYASTEETAAALMRLLGVNRRDTGTAGPRGMTEIYEADSGGFHVKGFEGKQGGDHINHVKAMGDLMYGYMRGQWGELRSDSSPGPISRNDTRRRGAQPSAGAPAV